MRLPRLLAGRGARLALRLADSRRAATAVEYGLIVAVIVIAMVASFQQVANATVGLWGNIQTRIGNATGN